MRFIIRGVVIGLLAGSAFFFFPFLFRFFFFFLIISFIIRLAVGRRWRRRGYHHGERGRHFYHGNEFYDNNTISIDGRGFVPPVNDNGNERRFPVL